MSRKASIMISGLMRLGFLTTWIERRSGEDGFGATPEPDVITKPDLHFSTLGELADHLGV